MPTAYTAFYDHVLPDVPGCPQARATVAIRNAAIEFCRRTGVWHIDHPAIDGEAGKASYPYAAGVAGAVVEKTLKAWYDGVEIFPAALEDLNDLYPGDWRTRTGTPGHFTQYTPRALILVPKPAAALTGALTLIVALKPSAVSTDIDDTVFEEYYQDIACGAKAELMMSPKKPYTDLKQAGVERQYFEDGIWTAHQRVAKALTLARRRTRPYYF